MTEKRCSETNSQKILELRKKGFHSPSDCPTWLESPLRYRWPERERMKHCDKCLTYMESLEELGRLVDGS